MTIWTTASLLLVLADRAEGALQPQPRADAVAGTLRALAAISDLPPVRPHELISALVIVGQGKPDDPPPVTSRRTTVRELADLVPDGTMGMAEVTAPALMLWLAFTRIPGDGPRIDAIQATARRELLELFRAADRVALLGFVTTMHCEDPRPNPAPLPFEVPKPSDTGLPSTSNCLPGGSRRDPENFVTFEPGVSRGGIFGEGITPRVVTTPQSKLDRTLLRALSVIGLACQEVDRNLTLGPDGLWRSPFILPFAPDGLTLTEALGMTCAVRWAEMAAVPATAFQAPVRAYPTRYQPGARRWLVRLPGVVLESEVTAEEGVELLRSLLVVRRTVWPAHAWLRRDPIAEVLELHVRAMEAEIRGPAPVVTLNPTVNASDIGRNW